MFIVSEYRSFLNRLTDEQLDDEYDSITRCSVHVQFCSEYFDKIDQIDLEIAEREHHLSVYQSVMAESERKRTTQDD